MPKTQAQKLKRKEKKAVKRLEKKLNGHNPKANKKAAKVVNKLVNKIVTGHGDYKSSTKAGGKWSKVGGLAGDLWDTIFGNGDYTYDDSMKMNYNTLAPAECMNNDAPPVFRNLATRGVRVQHREYFTDVTSNTTVFGLNEYPISLTNNALFPWLSVVSTMFEQIRIHGMIFEFKTLSGSVSTTQALGYVAMGVQYDISDPPFQSKIEFDNYEYALSGAPDKSFVIGVECAKDLTPAPILYVDGPLRNGYVADLRLSQLGRFCLATGGQAVGSNVIGEIWVTYDVELIKPKLSSPAVVQSIVMNPSSTVQGSWWGTAGNGFLPSISVYPTSASRCVFANNTSTTTTVLFTDTRLAGRAGYITYSGSATTITSAPTVTGSSTVGVVNGPTFSTASSTFAQWAILFGTGTTTWSITCAGIGFTGTLVSNYSLYLTN